MDGENVEFKSLFMIVILSFLCVYITSGVMIDLVTGHRKRGARILIITLIVLWIIYTMMDN